ncbi:MAG: hypothetical protein LBI13_10615 [Streptococcaceae bacterium]|jgi:anionic cell wall polymer biosynthesis LytR-Cps2A-Psr (LCP) family protein|nr:hypothetical protein [Streptococcaceae bacterium]
MKKRHEYQVGSSRRRVKKTSKFFKSFYIALGILTIIILSLLGKAYLDFRGVSLTVQTHKFQTSPVVLSNHTAFSTLIIGTSTQNNKKELAISVAASMNPITKKTTFLNIDSLKILPDGQTLLQVYDKTGDIGLQKKMQSLLGINFNKIILLDIDGLGDFVEATGGITIQNPASFIANGYKFEKGTLFLNSKAQTTAYCSLVNPNDYALMGERRRNVAMAIFENIKNISSLSNYQKLLNATSKNLKTTANMTDLMSLIISYHDSLSINKMNVHSTPIEGTDTESISQEELSNVKTMFLESLK